MATSFCNDLDITSKYTKKSKVIIIMLHKSLYILILEKLTLTRYRYIFLK